MSAWSAVVGLVGHHDTDRANFGAAIAGRAYNIVTAFSLALGVGSALGTFAAQNHGRGCSTDTPGQFLSAMRLFALAYPVAFAFAFCAI